MLQFVPLFVNKVDYISVTMTFLLVNLSKGDQPKLHNSSILPAHSRRIFCPKHLFGYLKNNIGNVRSCDCQIQPPTHQPSDFSITLVCGD